MLLFFIEVEISKRRPLVVHSCYAGPRSLEDYTYIRGTRCVGRAQINYLFCDYVFRHIWPAILLFSGNNKTVHTYILHTYLIQTLEHPSLHCEGGQQRQVAQDGGGGGGVVRKQEQ